MFFPWVSVAMLGFEASSVIAKRLEKVSLGGTQSLDEIQLMFFEENAAARDAGLSIVLGATMAGIVDQYCVLVAANEARLSA